MESGAEVLTLATSSKTNISFSFNHLPRCEYIIWTLSSAVHPSIIAVNTTYQLFNSFKTLFPPSKPSIAPPKTPPLNIPFPRVPDSHLPYYRQRHGCIAPSRAQTSTY